MMGEHEDVVYRDGEPVVPPGPAPEHDDHDGHTISLGAPSEVGPPLPKRPPTPPGPAASPCGDDGHCSCYQGGTCCDCGTSGPSTPEQEPVELDRLRKLIAEMEANLQRISAGWDFARAERDEARRRLLTVERERDRLRAELADSERRFADAVTDPRRPASDE